MEDGGTIFGLVQGKLVEMNAGPYISEDVLQKYLEEHPKLLAGEQINPVSPRRWLLIAREMSVPDMLDGKERWSLDHLFVDQDGIPTLVEVKRSSNTEIRRQIVGQLLDYAANGSQYWTVGKIREAFTATCLRNHLDETEVISNFVADAGEQDAEIGELIESFWLRVQRNMQDGRIRLLFVADVIPTELRRVIEFLNKQMQLAQVMGVEIRQYIGGDITAFVPRAFPQTIATAERSQKGSSAYTDVVQQLIRSERIPIGATLRFQAMWGNRSDVEDSLAKQTVSTQALWRPDDVWHPLQWSQDGESYSATGLAKKLYALAGKPKESIRGPVCWFYGDKSFVELANEL